MNVVCARVCIYKSRIFERSLNKEGGRGGEREREREKTSGTRARLYALIADESARCFSFFEERKFRPAQLHAARTSGEKLLPRFYFHVKATKERRSAIRAFLSGQQGLRARCIAVEISRAAFARLIIIRRAVISQK